MSLHLLRLPTLGLTLPFVFALASCDPPANPEGDEDLFADTSSREVGLSFSCVAGATCTGSGSVYSAVYRIGTGPTSRGDLSQTFTASTYAAPTAVTVSLQQLRAFTLPVGATAPSLHAQVFAAPGSGAPDSPASAPIATGTLALTPGVKGPVRIALEATAALEVGGRYQLLLSTDEAPVTTETLMFGVGAFVLDSYSPAGTAFRRSLRRTQVQSAFAETRFRPAGSWQVALALETEACSPRSTVCPLPCANDAECGSGRFCHETACVATKPLGTTCGGATDCTSGFCVDGVCCNTACTGAAAGCYDAPECSTGVCRTLPAGAGTSCVDDGAFCTRDECDGAGTCAHPPKADGVGCDDGLTCTAGDTCAAGSCGGSVSCATPPGECWEAVGACDAGGDCAYTAKGAGTGCGDDGNVCTTDVCDGAGQCTHPAGHANTVCRASTGACDPAETCTGASAACPADSLTVAGTICRGSTGVCDPAETCTGASAACPGDSLSVAGTICRAAVGLCDAVETCTGASPVCPADSLRGAGTICRASSGVCDPAETCTGASPACPGDSLTVAGTICRASAGLCDPPETCTGASAACPGDALTGAGTICRASVGVCDPAETCTGANAACPGDSLSSASTVCRASAGVCDVADTCTGASGACPGDSKLAAGTVCRARVAGTCDVAETCNGSANTCPTDVNPICTSCLAAYNAGNTSSSTVSIKPAGAATAFTVYCDQATAPGGWTVVQRRADATDFYRPWTQYVTGFGTVGASSSYWIGLDNLRSLTATPVAARVHLKRFSQPGTLYYADYSTFSVGPSSDLYRLTISGFSGNAGDSFTQHNGYQFSTYDADHDVYGGNCAVDYHGGWWYSACHNSNLNGQYFASPGTHASYANGVDWYSLTGYYESMQLAEILVR